MGDLRAMIDYTKIDEILNLSNLNYTDAFNSLGSDEVAHLFFPTKSPK